MTSTADLNFIALENSYRNANGITPMAAGQNTMDLSDIVATGSSKAFTTGYDAVVLDGPRSQYDIKVDNVGATTILDTTTNTSTTVTGETYLVFNASSLPTSATIVSGAPVYTNNAYFILSQANAGVAELYAAVLQRQPDLGGLEYWESQLASGQSLTQIASSFLAAAHSSPTLQATFGGDPTTMTNTAYVTALYEHVLNRSPDASGLSYWVSQLTDNDLTQSGVLASFTNATATTATINVTTGSTTANDSGWLINYSLTGGIADTGLKETVTSVLTEADSSNYLDTNLINTSGLTSQTVGSTSIFVINGSDSLSSTAPGVTVVQSSAFGQITVSGAGATGISPTTGNGDIYVAGNNDTVILHGNANGIVASNSNGTGPTSLTGINVIGFNATDYLQLQNSSTAAGIYAPTSGTPLRGSSLSFFPQGQMVGLENVYVVNVGSVGSGTATEMAAAANKVYVPTGAFGENIIFIGSTSTGNTQVDYWGTFQRSSAGIGANTGDSNGNHQIDASELSAQVTLTGVSASTLTIANFHQ